MPYVHVFEMNQYLIGDAANFLNCTPATLRRWDMQKKFRARRHKNGYRFYTMEMLKAQKQRLKSGRKN